MTHALSTAFFFYVFCPFVHQKQHFTKNVAFGKLRPLCQCLRPNRQKLRFPGKSSCDYSVLIWATLMILSHRSDFFFAMNSHFRNDAPFTSLQIYIMSQWCHFGWNTVPCDVFFTSQSRYSWLRLCIHAHLCTEVAAIDPQTAIIKNWLSFSLSSSYKNPISTVHLHLSPWMRRKREGSPGSSIISSGKELCF